MQQVAYVDTETGDICERRLNHSDGEAERFYRDLERRQVSVRVGIASIMLGGTGAPTNFAWITHVKRVAPIKARTR